MPRKTETIFNIPINIDNASIMLDILTYYASYKNSQKIVFTPNPEFFIKAKKEPEFEKILQSSDINLPDGIGIILASRILGGSIRKRICGSDMTIKLLEFGNKKCISHSKRLSKQQQTKLFPSECSQNKIQCVRSEEEEKWTVGIIGARNGVLEEEDELIRRLAHKYPNIKFVNLDNPGTLKDINFSDGQNSKLYKGEKKAQPENIFENENHRFNMVFACHGMGMQEKWIFANRHAVMTGIFMGIGGSLDFITGFTKRAPYIMRKIWFEWIWRVLQKPSHLKRVWNAVFVFSWIVITEKLRLIIRF